MGLASLGFDPGPADGLFGLRTRSAIEGWQSSQGGTPTGHLDAEAAKALMAAAKAAAEVAAKKIFSRDAAMETLSKAVQATERLSDNRDRAWNFAYLAEIQMKMGDVTGARRFIADALAAANKLDDGPHRYSIFAKIAPVQVATGDIQGAFATAWTIPEDFNRVKTLTGIAEAQAEAGEAGDAARTIGEAMSIAARTSDDFYRSSALVDVGRAQVMNGDIRGALGTAQRNRITRGSQQPTGASQYRPGTIGKRRRGGRFTVHRQGYSGRIEDRGG